VACTAIKAELEESFPFRAQPASKSHQAGNFKRRKTQAEIIKQKKLANRSIIIFLKNRFEELLAVVERESTSRFCKIVFAVLYGDSESENKEEDEYEYRVSSRREHIALL
jgi:uncharacterized protein YlxP (DUF503 family)